MGIVRTWPPKRTLKLPGGLSLALGERTLIMGIVNITPDSFSDGGKYMAMPSALHHVESLIAEGADMIDIGGESTRPGAAVVTVEEEIERVIPVVREVVRHFPDIPVSVDTYKAEVARLALEAGAHVINDVWGLKKDPQMASVVAQYACPVIIMHNRNEAVYEDFLSDVVADLRESVDIARRAGIPDDQIVLDPGIGFAKTYAHNLILMNHLERIAELGYPVLLGTSRKSMIRNTLGLPADAVVEGTAATVCLGIVQGCAIMRVHDVASIRKAVMMTDAIVRSGQDERGGY